MSTPSSERDEQLLSVGKQCSESTCHLVDYLPFKCQHCEQSFCGEHFKVEAHKCPKYDETKFDRIAPNCPLCNKPVAIPPNQDPNIRMEQHLSRDCSIMTGKSGKARTVPVCARVKCTKPLYAPIRCDQCKEQFCPQHRFPADHSCTPAPAPATSGNRLGAAPMKSLADLYSKTASSTKKAGSALGSIKASASNSSSTSAKTAPSTSSASPAAKAASSLPKNPIAGLKTDRVLISNPTITTAITTTPTMTTNPTTTTTTVSYISVPAGGPSKTPNSSIAKPRIINPSAYVPRPIFASA
ncbi:hypothetical protein HGRIS_006174 [Hohenbuehelia grisea]|uniref:AN1-type domain-containing protein n=1 Tax=Hohenbuehelia grisea TaxID=104357 RepID=A0ABR3K0B7_9AGAR